MARQAALNIADYTSRETMDNLAEVLDGVIENIQVSAVSEALKNTKTIRELLTQRQLRLVCV